MKKITFFTIFFLQLISFGFAQVSSQAKGFVGIKGLDLIKPNGEKLFIKGINLGNWLNPEGYLLLLKNNADSYRLIDQTFKEIVGEAVTDNFWREFQQHYVTRADIKYIRQTGMNTVRIPYHYKLLTDEPFMGYASKKHGYGVLDTVIKWCKEEGLYVILDLHDAPGGQTGINIDDSYGYPWLFVTEQHQQQFYQIWKETAKHYRNNKTVLGFDLLNEPIASSFFTKDTAMLNVQLDNLLRIATQTIREVDKNHLVIVSGSRWGQDYSIFKDWNYDDKLMFTCHRYHCDTTEAGIQDFLDYRKKFNRPFYMGETGHEPDEWIASFNRMLEKVNIGWTYWPYKKMGNSTSMLNIKEPENWNLIVNYAAANRNSFKLIRETRPDQVLIKHALAQLIENLKQKNCPVNAGYIKALGMKP
ncbi:glycosyl hydrolase family 5 [Pedobacter psychrophilus]|uniref:Glycosyl hydrolase family 5 n=1 Tax=Pedobacter psychrophilus TaxID=1826909 RepID=A0A179DFI2_9SPHI|nr:cellulase family glycosylhydrolase [Pedobacter psychrophilus]OAQ39807.1 glycosyl hydrolase family 5 [Pedobacter psychrophilus]